MVQQAVVMEWKQALLAADIGSTVCMCESWFWFCFNL
jgi:hypothetical protein